MIPQAVIQSYYGVNVCAHANKMMVLGAWVLRRWLGHVWKLVASVLTEQTPRVVASLFYYVSNSKKIWLKSQKSDF